MKKNIDEKEMIGLVLIALGITLFVALSVIGGFTKITGMTISSEASLGDVTTVYFLTFLISLAVAITLLAIYLMRRKK